MSRLAESLKAIYGLFRCNLFDMLLQEKRCLLGCLEQERAFKAHVLVHASSHHSPIDRNVEELNSANCEYRARHIQPPYERFQDSKKLQGLERELQKPSLSTRIQVKYERV